MLLTLFYVCVFGIGLSFGSFLNVLVYRLHKNKSILGRSHCPKCGHKIDWYDNIPLFSFIFLGGRCRHCKKNISWEYFFVELITGLLFIFSVSRIAGNYKVLSFLEDLPNLYHYLGFIFNVLSNWITIFVLVFIFIYDLKYQEIKDRILIPGIALVFYLNVFLPVLGKIPSRLMVLSRMTSIIVAVLLPVLFFLAQYYLTKKKGIGLGDLRIGALMGVALVRLKLVALALFISYVVGSVVCLILLIFKKKRLKSQIPLGPFLVIGTFVALFWGEKIINWYF